MFDYDLLLPEQQVHHPTPANVRTGTTAVGQDVGVVAPRFFEGICEDEHLVESSLGVDFFGEHTDSRCTPSTSNFDWTGEIAGDVTQKNELSNFLGHLDTFELRLIFLGSEPTWAFGILEPLEFVSKQQLKAHARNPSQRRTVRHIQDVQERITVGPRAILRFHLCVEKVIVSATPIGKFLRNQ